MFKPQLKSPLRNSIMRALLAGNSTPSVPSFYFNFSNPQNVTLGAAQARGNITSTQNAHITMSASLSRVVGVAPLYVNIDMTGTTSDLTTNATHDLFYSVNWGDSGAGQWANGVQSAGLTDKNWSFGPVGGHVFETPGTYLVTPTSTDGVNSAAKPGYVTVLDPNDVYAGTDTICISHSNNFTGAPSGASQINTAGNTDMYAAWNTYKGSNKRILFCKADNWTISATISANGLTNGILGGYGIGVAATFGSGTMVTAVANPLVQGVFSSSGASDYKFCNIRLDSAYNVAFQSLAADDYQITWYKMEARNASTAFSLSPNLVMNSLFKHDQTCLYECLHDQAYGYAGNPPDTPRVTGVTATNATPCVFTSVGHPFKRTDIVQLTGTLPTGFSLATDYRISGTNLTANTFSLTANASPYVVDVPIASTSTGTVDVTAKSLGGGQGLYVALTKGGIMGCYFDNCNHGEQTVRIPYIHTSHISNNYIARPNQQKNALKIHSRGYEAIVTIPGVSGWSEKFIISANFTDLRGGYSMGDVIPNNGRTATQVGYSEMVIMVGSPSEGPNEFLRNYIVENNYTQTCLGSSKDSRGFIVSGCPNVTIRNNILDASAGATAGDRGTAVDGYYVNLYMNFASISSSTKDSTTGVRIYNNTMYSNLRNAETADFVNVGQPSRVTGVTNTIATPGVFTTPGTHYILVNERVRLLNPPAPLALATDYYVTAANLTATTFSLSTTPGGAALALSSSVTSTVQRALNVDNLVVQNNLWYLPHATTGYKAAIWLAANAAPTAVTNTNNTDSVAGGAAGTSPIFAVQPPVALADWRPTSTSYAIDKGVTVPVLKDFNMASRVGGTYDLGAVLP